jgi:CO/xanthine dehydrogenase Mo-binding subunit
MTTTHRVIGKGVPRSDGLDKVTGRGKYSLDMTIPGTLWAKVLRSPFPHARIVKVDATRALQLPGVHAVLAPDEVIGLRTGKRLLDEPILAWDKVLFIGDKVAAVAAEDEEIAEQALALIEVEYEELPAVFKSDEARATDAPILHPDFNSYTNIPAAQETPSNVFAHTNWSKGDIAEGFAAADVIVERTYTTPRTHQAYLEPHNTLVWIDPEGRVQVWLGTKSPFSNRASLAAVIDVPPAEITVNSAYVGGDFGGKGDITGAPICYFLAKKTGRPVKMVLDYSEELYAMNPRHESVMRVKAGAKQDGTLTAWESEVYFNSGAYGGYKPVPGSNLGGIAEIAGPYVIPNVAIDAYQVYTNTVPCGFHRSPGEVQGIFAGESHMDELAKELGIDPIEIRLKNVIHDGDETPVGHHFQEIKLEEVLREAARASAFSSPRNPNVGRGIAIGHRSQIGGQTHVGITVHENGDVTANNSIFDPGTGTHTIVQQVVAEELGIDVSRIRVVPYNTDDVENDTGVGGSRGSYVGPQAADAAASDLKAKLVKLAAEFEGWDEETVQYESGYLINTRSGDRTAMEVIAERAGEPVSGQGSILDMTPNPYTSFVAQVAEVEIDPETAEPVVTRFTSVHDTSQIINPIGFHGQIEGGIMNSYGFAMMEELSVDEGGRITNPSFADFKIPTERDIPPLTTSLVETTAGRGKYRVKGIGEHSNLTTAAAIANAITAAVGVRLYSLPLTAEKLWDATR